VDDDADGPLGVAFTTVLELVRLTRAVSGVGAEICDFFGVSVGLERLLPLEEAADESKDLDALVVGAGLAIFERARGVMYGAGYF